MLTGEARPVAKAPGEDVYGVTLNAGRGVAAVRATAVGVDAVLSRIVRLVDEAQTARAPIEAFADRVSGVFVPVIVAIAVATFAVWFGLAAGGAVPARWTSSKGDVLFALLFSLAVLVISRPCALGLATHTAVVVATALGASRHGILFKGGGEALQAATGLGAVFFDQTGTRTEGRPAVPAALRLHGNPVSPDTAIEPWVLAPVAAAGARRTTLSPPPLSPTRPPPTALTGAATRATMAPTGTSTAGAAAAATAAAAAAPPPPPPLPRR